jgi:hypothetical protein
MAYIIAKSNNNTYIFNPEVSYRDCLIQNFNKIDSFTRRLDLTTATNLVRSVKGFENATPQEVDAAIFGGGQPCVGIYTSITDSISPNGNPRAKKEEPLRLIAQGVYINDKTKQYYVKGLVISKKPLDPNNPPAEKHKEYLTALKDVVKQNLHFAEWISIPVVSWEMVETLP